MVEIRWSGRIQPPPTVRVTAKPQKRIDKTESGDDNHAIECEAAMDRVANEEMPVTDAHGENRTPREQPSLDYPSPPVVSARRR